MLTGDTNRRTPPTDSGKQNLDPNAGPINNIFFTCARTSHDPPSWPPNSDGSKYGMASDERDHQGVGFPLQKCDAMASPLRADAHFPSCYNPDAGLTSYKDNMAFPTAAGNGKLNCPEGYIHVPRLIFEVYWNTQQFDDRWTPDGKTQPFVLSNGDVTGYSLHADVLAAWDEDVLQTIIDGCNVQHQDMDTCPGVESNTETCTCEGEANNFRISTDSPLKKLPGNNPLSGFQYGDAPVPSDSDSSNSDSGNSDSNDSDSSDGSYAEETQAPGPETEAPVDRGYDEPAVTQAPLPTAEPVCSTKTKTVVETVTVWEDAAPEETAGTYAKRHLERHARRHRF